MIREALTVAAFNKHTFGRTLPYAYSRSEHRIPFSVINSPHMLQNCMRA